MNALLPVLVLLLIVCTVGGAIVILTGLLGPKKKPSVVKSKPYECGFESSPPSNHHISVNYYLTAILFILFDIEIIFMYPWAVYLKNSLETGYGVQAFWAMMIFLFVFVFGLVWEIASKALSWD